MLLPLPPLLLRQQASGSLDLWWLGGLLLFCSHICLLVFCHSTRACYQAALVCMAGVLWVPSSHSYNGNPLVKFPGS